ncbi:Uncharacterised protein [Providencia stuartii]|nr:Uncharacterised protein [Providencia stuartii]
MGGDGRMLSAKVEYTLDDDNRVSTRLVYAKVNKESYPQNKIYPKSETIKGVDLGWWHNFDNMVSTDAKVWVSKTDYDTSDDIGASVMVTVPFEW